MSEPTDHGARYRELLNRWDHLQTRIDLARQEQELFETLGDKRQARDATDEIESLLNEQDAVNDALAALAKPEGQP